jgi:catechol 2,3-dioxygenase-like lactoylglutathione lyase family enzyme
LALSVDSLTFDCRDPEAIATFWASVLGYELTDLDDEGAEIRDPSGGGWRILFLVVPEGKTVKNRVHLDLRPATSMAEEKARVAGLGAKEFRYVAEGGSYWTVMLDPEDNEFCVLRGPADGWSPDG